MNDSIWESLLRRVAALGCAALVISSLVAISIQRADQRNKNLAVSTQQPVADQSGDAGGTTDVASPDVSAGDQATSAAPGAVDTGTGAAASSSASGAARSTASGTNTASAAATSGLKPHKGTDCPDYNPNVGVYCDHYTVGGTTVLSGPLAVYGEQGLKASQSWLTYFNTVYAPSHNVRTASLKWYDDNLDPNKTLQYVQRMNEVDHVLYIGGVTSPEAISKYVMDAPCLPRAGKNDCPIAGNKGLPFIGDIGLSPKSYTTPLIYATAPSPEVRAHIDTRTAKDLFGAKKIGVVYDVLPGVDTSTVRAAWRDAEKQYGVELGDRYVEISSTASSCSAEFSKASAGQPDFIWLPIAAGPMLACLGAAKTAGVAPNAASSPWLKGWHGGSGLQVEVDNCRPTCEGMITGNIFHDPRSWPSPEMELYRKNVAKYAPSIDYTGFIAVNYYANGPVITHLVEANNLQWNLTRKNLIDAANKFGPYDTGFGNTITWRATLPRIPTECGYIMKVQGDTWVYQNNKICL
jgi:ABC-type branched-subunit amino acid transport system substrate-binding protein